MSNKSREEVFSERDRRSCSVIVKESDDNSNNDHKRKENNNNKSADVNTWTTNVNNKIIDNTTLNDEGNNADDEKKWWQTFYQTICFTRPQSMPLWFEILLFGLLSACFFFFPWSSNPIHILFIALSFFFAIILCAVYEVLFRITLHRARRAAEQEWDEYHFKAEENINSFTNSLDAVNNNTTIWDHIKIYDNNNNEGKLNNTTSTHIPLLPLPPPPPIMINLEFEENAKLSINEQRALSHFINNKYTHHVQHIGRRVMIIVSSLQLLLLGLLVLLSPLVIGVWTAPHKELEIDTLYNNSNRKNVSITENQLRSFSWRRLVQLTIIDNGGGDAKYRFGVQTYPNEINIKVCLLHAWFLFTFNLPFAIDFIIGLVHLAVAMAFYRYESALTMLLIALWMSVPLINMIASCLIRVCCYCRNHNYEHHHHHHYHHNRTVDCKFDAENCTNVSCWCDNSYNNHTNQTSKIINFIACEPYMPSKRAINFTAYNNYTNNNLIDNINNNVIESKKSKEPNTTTRNQVPRTTHKSVLPTLHSRTAASQQQGHRAEYWDLDNYYNADEYDAQNDINSNTFAHYPFAHQITRTQQGANVFWECSNDHHCNEEAPEDTPMACNNNSRDGCNIRATSTTITPLMYSPREKDELESITSNKPQHSNANNIIEDKHHSRAKQANSSITKNKHKIHDRIIEPEKYKEYVKETKILKENKHAIRPEILLSLHGELDRRFLIDFVVNKEIANLSYMLVDCDDAIIRLANSKFTECVGTVTSSLLLRRLHDVLIWLQVDQSERVMSELEKIKMNMSETELTKTQSLTLLPTSSSSLSSTQQLKEYTLPITGNQPATKFNQHTSLQMSMRKNNLLECSELFVFCKRITLQGKCPYNVLSKANKENNNYGNNKANESDNMETKNNKISTTKNVDVINTICESSAANKERVNNNNNNSNGINKVNAETDKLVLHPNKEMHYSIQEYEQKCCCSEQEEEEEEEEQEQEEYTRPVFVIHLDVLLVQNHNLLNFKPCLLFHTPQYHEYCNALGLPVAILCASDGTIVFWSTNAAKYTGISESAILSFPMLANFTPTLTADNASNLGDSMSSINSSSSSSANEDNNINNSVLRGKVVLPTRPYSKKLSTRTYPLCFDCSLRLAKGEQACIEQERIKHEVDLHISQNYSYIKQKYCCQSGQDDGCYEENCDIGSLNVVPEWMRIPQLRAWAQTNSLLLLMLEEKLNNRKHGACNEKNFDTVTNTKSLQKTEKSWERNDQELKQHSQEQQLTLHKIKLSECEEDNEQQEWEEDIRPAKYVSQDDKEDKQQTEIELEEESYILADGSSNDDDNNNDNNDDDQNDNDEEEESEKSEEENLKNCIDNEYDKYEVDDKQPRSEENLHAIINNPVYNTTVLNTVIPEIYENDYDHQSNDKSIKSDAVVEEVMNTSNYCEDEMQYVNEHDNIDNNENINNIFMWNEEVEKTTQLPDLMLHSENSEENIMAQILKKNNRHDVNEVDQLPLTNANTKSMESKYKNDNDNNYTQTTGANRLRRQVLISPPIAEMSYSEAENEQANNYNITSEFMTNINEEGKESNVMKKKIDADVSNNFSSQYNTVENAMRDEVISCNAPYTQSQIGDNALKYYFDSNSINKLDDNDRVGVKGKALDGKPPFVLPLAMVHLHKNNGNNVIVNTEQKDIYSANRINNIEHNNVINDAPHDSNEEVHASVLANPSTALASTHVQEKQVTWGQLLSRDEGTIASCLIRTPLNEPFRFGRSSRCELCVHDSFVSSIQFTLTRTLRVHYKNENTNSLADNNLADFNVIDDTNVNNNAKEIASRSFVVTLQDKSVNGTYVNVKKIGKDKTCVLHDGDLITFRLSTSQFFLGFVFRLLHYHKSAEHRTRRRKELISSAHHVATSKHKDNKREEEGNTAAMLKRRESEAESPVSEMLAESLHSNFANRSKSSKEFNASAFNKKNTTLYDSTLHENQFNLSCIVEKNEHLPWRSEEEEEEEEEELLEKSQSAASAPATPATLPYTNNIHADSTNFAGTSQHTKNKKVKGNMKQTNGARSLSAFWVQRRLSLKRKVDHPRSASAHLNSHASHSTSSAHGSNPENYHTRHRTMSETQRPRHRWSDNDGDNDGDDNDDDDHHHVIPPVRDNLRLPLSRHDKRNTTLSRVDSDRLSNYKNSGSRASSSFTYATHNNNNNNNMLDSGVGEEVRIREITSSSPYIREYESVVKSGDSIYEAHFSNSGGGAAPYHEQVSSTSLSPSSSVEDYNSHYDDHDHNLEDEQNAAEYHARSRHGSDPYSTNHRRHQHSRRIGFRGNSSQDRYRSQPEDEYHHNNNNNSSSSNAGNNSYHESQYQHEQNQYHNHNHNHHHHHHHRKRETIEWKIGEEMLGKGGNAEVYLGINLTNGQLIAVKRVLLPTAINDVQRDPATAKAILQQYRSLQEEINVLSKAIHPNIVCYYGSSQNKTYFNILLEFVPGGSLRHLLDNFGALSPGVIFSYLRQALEGLRYLHAREIVHGDIKTANILISEKGQAKLTDFGTARLLNRQHASMLLTSDNKSTERKDINEELSLPSSSLSRRLKEDEKENHTDINNAMSGGTVGTTLRLGGTLRWMDPALFRLPSHILANYTAISNDNNSTATNNNKLSKPASESPTPSRSGPNKASDIWSVGCALIEMMSGEGPWYEYEFESEEQIINLLRYTNEPPEIPECAECPELMTIAQSCLQLTPESRPTCEMLLLNVIAASERLQSQMQTPSASPARDSSGPLPNSSQFTDNTSDSNNNKNNDNRNVDSKGTNSNNIVETNVQNKSFRSQSHKNDNNDNVDDDDDIIDGKSNNKEKKIDNMYNEAVHDVKSTFNQSEGVRDSRNELQSSNKMYNEFAAKDE